MNVVIVDGDVSYPMTSGKRLRTLNLMLQAAKRHRITYVGRCAADSEEARLAPPFLREHGIESILIHDPIARKSGVAFYGRLLANLFSPRPYSVTSHQSEAMRLAILDLAKRERVDVWQLEWTPYLNAVDASLSGPRVVIAHNVDTLIWQRYHDTEKNLLKKMYLRTQWKKFARFEREAFRKATRVVAVSDEDATLIRNDFGQPNVDVVDNGIDRTYFEQVKGERDPKRILFLGALDWRPNLDAVALLFDSIFPRVIAQEPNARLVIVGRNPPAHVVERARQMPGVELHASVPDVRPFLASAGVMAVPLRIGGGSRLKILESLASGLPVVSTKVGAEGLHIKPDLDYVQADENAMADALVHAIRKPDAMRALAEHGRAFVLDTYDWAVLAKKLEASWERALLPSPSGRGVGG